MLKKLTPEEVNVDSFDIPTYFNGKTRAYGVFQDRFGRIKRKLSVVMEGRWQDGCFILEEHFSYEDGRTEDRTWTVTLHGDGRFSAESADSVGKGHGMAADDCIHMQYIFRLQMKNRILNVDFDDRLYKLDDKRVFNRAVMSKWGIRLGEVLLLFEKEA